MPRISVIMPVYNAEVCVEEAIRAVLDQDFEDFELIVCDDGSTDNTLINMVRAIGDLSNVHVVSHNHAGVSFARNRGLELALGDWVAFADVDDLPYAGWLSELHSIATAGDGCDLATCGYEVMSSKGELLYDTLGHVGAEPVSVSAEDFTCDLFSNRMMYQGYVWNKLFRRDLIQGVADEKPVRFRRGITRNEDRLFVYEYLKRCENVVVSGKPCYSYRASEPYQTYCPSMATEISAFDEMATDLSRRIGAGEDMGDALHYLGKDTFRALVELFCAASASKDPDATWIAERLVRLSSHQGEFSDYPSDFRQRMNWALARIRKHPSVA